jgi:membrane-associated protease RseP (regulator of RpoE activity)
MIAGVAWSGIAKPYDLANIHYGLTYAILIMTFLTMHEFGHYFASRIHNVNVTLPYYIPIPPTPFIPISFGTMGAVIKIREQIPNRKALFDIGVSGPIAGFVTCIVFLTYGLLTLPGIEYLMNIHPEIAKNGLSTKSLFFGDTILYSTMSHFLANPKGFLPPMNEIYHYPFLCVGWFGLFVTALNMLPIGQLDGGHITYAMFGKKAHKQIAKISWYILLILGLSALMQLALESLSPNESTNSIIDNINNTVYFTLSYLKIKFPILFSGWFGWFFWAIFTRLVIKMNHPYVDLSDELNTTRKVIGWISILILITCFSINGIYIIE